MPLLAAGAALLLVIGACSSSNGGDSSAGTPTTKASAAAAASVLGPTKAATGTPLKVGFIYDGQSAASDTRSQLIAAQATVKYVNAYLGGVTGRPLALDVCSTDSTPSGATSCANQMLADKVPVVLNGSTAEPAPIVTALKDASVPMLTYIGTDTNLLLGSNSYMMTNPVSFVALPIKIAQEQKFKKVAVILIDIPAAAGQVKAIADPVFAKAGLTASYTAVKPGTPDMTPQVQAALSGGNQEFLIVGDPAFCISALKSLKTLSFTGPIIINSQCLSPDVPKAVPGGVDNIIVGTSESLDPDDAEVKLYDTIMAKYAPGQAPHASATDTAYGAIMGFVRAMTGATGDVTPASVVATFGSMAPQPMPLLHGSTFQCNRKASTLTPAVCTTGIAMVTLDAKGNAKKTEPIDATKYISLGS